MTDHTQTAMYIVQLFNLDDQPNSTQMVAVLAKKLETAYIQGGIDALTESKEKLEAINAKG